MRQKQKQKQKEKRDSVLIPNLLFNKPSFQS